VLRDVAVIVLAMIVRDEAHSIAATIASALPHVDAWAIADTGSEDGTVAEVERACAGRPGQLLHVPFVDFSQARNAVMDAIEPGSWILWLDADDRLVNGEALRSSLEHAQDCYALEHVWSTGHRFGRPTLVRAGSGWRFVGRVHEVLRKPGAVERFLRGISVYQHRTQVSEFQTRARQPWDVTMLREMLVENPADPRARRYLAATLAALGRHEEAREASAQGLTYTA
jgi:glycosyltransferase involved in cell wall biosynthesis